MHRRCISAKFCTLVLAFCTLFTYSAFFSDQITLPWEFTGSVYNPNSFAQGFAPHSTATTNLSNIIFVLAGSTLTWDQRRSYSELWWRTNHTKGHVWLDQAPAAPWPDSCPPYMVSRNMSHYGKKASASRIAAAVVEAYQMVSSGSEKDRVHWFVMGDDDTVFFVENLVAVLQKYDHNQMYYVGMPSESVQQDIYHSYAMAFGGGGFAISYPAAAELARAMDGCLDRYISLYGGDHRVSSCLAELGIPLTREPGFHQVDITGDVYGMLAAHPVAPLVSLHHLDYVKPISSNKHSQLESLQSLFSAYRVDPSRILQQTFCYEVGTGVQLVLSISVSWGYTVQVYPLFMTPNMLETPLQTFKTWRSVRQPFTFNTRQIDDPCARPFIFLFDRVLHSQTAATLTQYTRAKTSIDGVQAQEEAMAKCDKWGLSAASGIQVVRVSAPKMDPLSWKQAPRRWCCTARRTERGRMLKVQIKYCSPGEPTIPRLPT